MLVVFTRTHTHTHTRLAALCPGLPGTRKVAPTGSHVHAKSGSIEEMARDRHIVTINTTNTHTHV